jgi:nucleoside-diphosphate-sugar epimerase
VRVAVTGGAGFIGSHTAAALRARGDAVFILDRATGQDLSLTCPPLDVDAVIHLAGSCSTSASLLDPLATFRDTVLTAVNVMAAIPTVPIVITSSVKARDGLTPYGAAKRMVETWAFEERRRGRSIIVNRPGTVYGPGQVGSEESGWIAWFLRARDEGRRVVVNGDGHQVRDLLHVADYVALLLRQIDHPAQYDSAEPWDVGGGDANSVSVEEMVDYLGLEHTHGPARDGDAARYVGANLVPGWKPERSWRAFL